MSVKIYNEKAKVELPFEVWMAEKRWRARSMRRLQHIQRSGKNDPETMELRQNMLKMLTLHVKIYG